MISRVLKSLPLAVALALGYPSASQASPSVLDVDCPESGVCREKLTGMPLKVLPRPFSNIYKTREANSGNILEANVRAFYPLYVFARQDLDVSVPNDPKGWYQVGGSPQGKPSGWMRAKDVLEWKQALIVSYTHPGEGDNARHRALMFSDKARLEALVDSPQRADQAEGLYAQLNRQEVPAGVVSKEPEKFVDITEKFYMLPIVDFETRNIEGDDTRLLQVAAAVPGARSDKDTLDNPEFREQAVAGAEMSEEKAKALVVDLVFVMDMTGSMQPYIDRTKAAMAAIAKELGQQAQGKLRFGLVGYRDDVSKMPTIEFTSKNFTPELVDAEKLVAILDSEAKASKAGSGDYAEEVFAGIKTALESDWDANALRLVILVGDASSHPADHAQNTMGLDAKTLRLMADDRKVHILSLHLQDPRAKSDRAQAELQFETLARVRGSEDKPAYIAIDVEDEKAFQDSMQQATGAVVAEINKWLRTKSGEAVGQVGEANAASAAVGVVLQDLPASGETLTDLPQQAPKANDTGELQDTPAARAEPAVAEAPQPEAGTTKDPAAQAGAMMSKLIETALVEYLGKEQNPPRDVIVWAFDRDLANPVTRALDVRVLLTKQQLSDLVGKLKAVSTAMKKAEITQMAFFDALASVAAGTAKNPDQIRNADKLKDAGLLDAFIASLPYKSDILNLSNEVYAAMTPSERSELQRGIDAKLALYRVVNEDVEGWVKLNETDEDAMKVYPLHIDALP